VVAVTRKPIDWEHLTRVVRLYDKRGRELGAGSAKSWPQLEWEHYRAEYEKRLARELGREKAA